MANKTALSKLPDIPLAKPGFDTLGMSAPVLVQLNPNGKWENCAPEGLDGDKLRTVVQQLIKTDAISAAHSYCSQCAAENKIPGSNKYSSYVPVIMMPIYAADQCPFDMNCEIEKYKEEAQTKAKKTSAKRPTKVDNAEQVEKSKPKKRGFVLQRLTDFDLLSQW